MSQFERRESCGAWWDRWCIEAIYLFGRLLGLYLVNRAAQDPKEWFKEDTCTLLERNMRYLAAHVHEQREFLKGEKDTPKLRRLLAWSLFYSNFIQRRYVQYWQSLLSVKDMYNIDKDMLPSMEGLDEPLSPGILFMREGRKAYGFELCLEIVHRLSLAVKAITIPNVTPKQIKASLMEVDMMLGLTRTVQQRSWINRFGGYLGRWSYVWQRHVDQKENLLYAIPPAISQNFIRSIPIDEPLQKRSRRIIDLDYEDTQLLQKHILNVEQSAGFLSNLNQLYPEGGRPIRRRNGVRAHHKNDPLQDDNENLVKEPIPKAPRQRRVPKAKAQVVPDPDLPDTQRLPPKRNPKTGHFISKVLRATWAAAYADSRAAGIDSDAANQIAIDAIFNFGKASADDVARVKRASQELPVEVEISPAPKTKQPAPALAPPPKLGEGPLSLPKSDGNAVAKHTVPAVQKANPTYFQSVPSSASAKPKPPAVIPEGAAGLGFWSSDSSPLVPTHLNLSSNSQNARPTSSNIPNLAYPERPPAQSTVGTQIFRHGVKGVHFEATHNKSAEKINELHSSGQDQHDHQSVHRSQSNSYPVERLRSQSRDRDRNIDQSAQEVQSNLYPPERVTPVRNQDNNDNDFLPGSQSKSYPFKSVPSSRNRTANGDIERSRDRLENAYDERVQSISHNREELPARHVDDKGLSYKASGRYVDPSSAYPSHQRVREYSVRNSQELQSNHPSLNRSDRFVQESLDLQGRSSPQREIDSKSVRPATDQKSHSKEASLGSNWQEQLMRRNDSESARAHVDGSHHPMRGGTNAHRNVPEEQNISEPVHQPVNQSNQTLPADVDSSDRIDPAVPDNVESNHGLPPERTQRSRSPRISATPISNDRNRNLDAPDVVDDRRSFIRSNAQDVTVRRPIPDRSLSSDSLSGGHILSPIRVYDPLRSPHRGNYPGAHKAHLQTALLMPPQESPTRGLSHPSTSYSQDPADSQSPGNDVCLHDETRIDGPSVPLRKSPSKGNPSSHSSVGNSQESQSQKNKESSQISNKTVQHIEKSPSRVRNLASQDGTNDVQGHIVSSLGNVRHDEKLDSRRNLSSHTDIQNQHHLGKSSSQSAQVPTHVDNTPKQSSQTRTRDQDTRTDFHHIPKSPSRDGQAFSANGNGHLQPVDGSVQPSDDVLLDPTSQIINPEISNNSLYPKINPPSLAHNSSQHRVSFPEGNASSKHNDFKSSAPHLPVSNSQQTDPKHLAASDLRDVNAQSNPKCPITSLPRDSSAQSSNPKYPMESPPSRNSRSPQLDPQQPWVPIVPKLCIRPEEVDNANDKKHTGGLSQNVKKDHSSSSSPTDNDTSRESQSRDRIRCVVCQEKPRIATMGVRCGHIACEGCWDQWLTIRETCPACMVCTRQNNLIRLRFYTG